jgi:uncharacterized membrane protein
VSDAPPPPPSSFGMPPPSSAPDAGTALSYGWKKFQDNVGVLVAVILVPVAVQVVLGLIGVVALRGIAGQILLSIISTVVSLALEIGIFNAALAITAGQPVDVGKAFSSDRWGEWIAFAFLFGLLVGVGAIFCGVGALIVLAFFGFAPFYFLDQRKSIGEAFNASLEATRSMAGIPFAIAICALVGIAGVILCVVGLLVTMPIAYIAVGYLYRRVNNQAVAP